MFVLPELPPQQPGARSGEEEEEGSSSDEERAGASVAGGGRAGPALDLHSVDVYSAEFLALPANVRHDILSELKETRKQSSWGRLHEMPRDSNAFSIYQMQRLLKRRSVQESLETAEKEMGGRTLNLVEMEELMRDKGALDTAMAAAPGQRIAADTYTRFILLSTTASKASPTGNVEPETETRECERNNLNAETKVISSSEIFISDDDTSNGAYEELPNVQQNESSEADDTTKKQLRAAQNFMFENSGLTQEQILAVIKSQITVPDRAELSVAEPSTTKAAFGYAIDGKELKESEEMHVAQKKLRTNLRDIPSMDELLKKPVVKTSDKSRKRQSIDLCKPVDSIKRRATNKELAADTSFEILSENSSQSKTKGDENVPSKNISTEILSDNSPVKVSDNFIHEFETKSVSQKTLYYTSSAVVSTIESYDGNSPKQENEDPSSSDDDLIEVKALLKPQGPLSMTSSEGPLQVVIHPNLSDFGEDIFSDVFKDTTKLISQQQKESLHCKSTFLVVTKPEEKEKEPFELSTQQQNTAKYPEEQLRKIAESMLVVAKNLESSTERNDELLKQIEVEETEETSSSEENMQKEDATLTLDELQKLQDTLNVEGMSIEKQQARAERLAATINDQMIQEAQELLQLFGVPYIVAPMEAEAQCAFLDQACLSDGTITDDSDIWLFGGQKVYKNFFDQKKHVLQFRDIDIQRCFKLTRTQLVLLALLVGSDYTTGLPGVGPVTALEILAAFPSNSKAGPSVELLEGLLNFRDWYSSGMAIGKGHTKLRAKLKDLQLTGEFPSAAVVEAYMSPTVDESMDKFTWGVPDVESIKEFTRIKFGWSGEKTQGILQPILKKLNIKITQLSIDSYFQVKPQLPPSDGSLSKRVQKAVNRFDSNFENGSEEEITPSKRAKSEFANAFHEKAKKRGRGKISAQSSSRGRRRATDTVVNPEKTACDATTGISASEAEASTSANVAGNVSRKEFILQREKDKLNLLKNKLKAIEVFRKSKLDRTPRDRKPNRKILRQAMLSESSSSSDE